MFELKRKRDAKQNSSLLVNQAIFLDSCDFLGLADSGLRPNFHSENWDFPGLQSFPAKLLSSNLLKDESVRDLDLENIQFPHNILQNSYFASTMASPLLHLSRDLDSEPQKDLLSGFDDPWESMEIANTDSFGCDSSTQEPPQKIQKKRGRKIGSFRKTPKILKTFVTTKVKKLSLREKITLSVKENLAITDTLVSAFAPELKLDFHKKHPLGSNRNPRSNFSALLCSDAFLKSKKTSKGKSVRSANRHNPKSGPEIATALHCVRTGSDSGLDLTSVVCSASSKSTFEDLQSMAKTLEKMRNCSQKGLFSDLH